MSRCFPGQLRIKYPDVTGEFLIVNLTKGGTGLGKLNCKRSDQSNIHENYKSSFILKNKSSQEAAAEEQDATLRFFGGSCLKPYARGQIYN